MSLNYKYDAKAVQAKYNNEKPDGGFILETCSLSGLPLGYLPSRKIAFRGTLPFAQLSEHDVYISVETALRSDASSQERVFAFFALLYKLPPAILHWHTQHICPDWKEPRLAAMLGNNGLKNFAGFVETVSTLPPRILDLFPAFSISAGLAFTNSNLKEFPSILARWIGIAESSKASEKARAKGDLLEQKTNFRLFHRKSRDERLSIFDPRVATSTELTDYSRILADFYERKHTPAWEAFVRNPSSGNIDTVKKVIDRVREVNVSEDDFSDALTLSIGFLRWLEEHYLRQQEHAEIARRTTRLIANADTLLLQSMDIENVQELLEVHQQREKESGKPQRATFASMDSYLSALKVWRIQTNPQERKMY